jgi:Rieske Fe-S protein
MKAMDDPQAIGNDAPKAKLPQRGVERRRFMEMGVLAASGMVGLTLLGIGGRFAVGDSLEDAGVQWVTIGEISSLLMGKMNQLVYNVRSKDAWRTIEEKGLLYVLGNDDGTEFVVLSAICTHLGCNVHWEDETGNFRCPCHDAHFDRTGAVLSGPPRSPLARLETKIENGALFALV